MPLTLQRLNKVYGTGVHAVRDLDLEIRDGEFFTLLGPSGCGKTTTLRMIAGFYDPDQGDIEIGGAASSCLRTAVAPRWSSRTTRSSRT